MSSFRTLFEHQQELHGLIHRAVTNLKKVGRANITVSRVQSRMDCMKVNWGKFQDNHLALREIYGQAKDETRAQLKEHEYFKNDWYSTVEEAFLDAQEEMGNIYEELHTPDATADEVGLANQSAIALNHPDRASHSGRLPRLDLPKFNGDYNEWAAYKDLFQSLVGYNTSLTCVEKLQYLKLSLTGSAATRLKNIAITADNFERAWDSLVTHYENQRILVHTYLSVLFSTKPVTHGTATEIEQLLNDTQQALDALQALKRPVDTWSDLLVYMIVNKLDSTTILEWEKDIGASTDPPTYKKLETFLIGRARALQAFERSVGTLQPAETKPKNKGAGQSHHTAEAQSSSTAKCVACNSSKHYVWSCAKYKTRTVAQRKDLIQQKNLCFNCLAPHLIRNCASTKRCITCGAQHHTSIHDESVSFSTSTPAPTAQPETTSSAAAVNIVTNSSVTANVSDFRVKSVLLATAIVRVVSYTGELVEARALLDQGSEVSIVTEEFVQRLRLPRARASIPIVGMGSDKSRATNGEVVMTVKSRVAPSFSCDVKTLILPRLTGRLPSVEASSRVWPHLLGLESADPGYATPDRIDIVFGATVYKRVLQGEVRKGHDTAPIAQRTPFGWILSGDTPGVQAERGVGHSYHCAPDFELQDLMQQFFLQEESFPSSYGELSQDEAECDNHYRTTHSRDTCTGEYIVRLPFKRTTDDLRDSKFSAARMLERMEAKFLRDPNLHGAYGKFVKEYENLGHMQRATRNGPSLNDCLHIGPKIFEDLSDVILRWRQYPYVFSADIEKMYRQIRVHPDDWDLQRILWRHTLEEPASAYQLRTVTYGMACAPYLAIRTLHQLTQDEGQRFPDAVNAVLKETYVDNVHSGTYSIEDGQEKIRQIDNLLKAGGFPLREWVANNNELLVDISESRRAAVSSRSFEKEPVFQALGLSWQVRKDSFVFTSRVNQEVSMWTKRSVLSRIAQCFDPLGWLSPVIIRAKIFMRDLWVEKLEWDEPLPEPLANQWKNFLEQLSYVENLSMPRWIGLTLTVSKVELHGFSDASQAAIGAVAYLRVTNKLGEVCVSLIAAKTKVAPQKSDSTARKRVRAARVTIPRLELTAAVLLTRLISRVLTELNRDDIMVHLWTDSTVTLYWIKGHASQWKDFVKNRVKVIQGILPNARWHHVSGEDNPADCASRGLASQQLTPDHIWWQVPNWLTQSSQLWPTTMPHLEDEVDLEERKRVVATVQGAAPALWPLIERYSSLTRLLRITALCKRAIARFKSRNAKMPTGPLTPQEIETSRIFWIRAIQTAYFGQEIHQLRTGRTLSCSNPLLKLTPVIDNSGLLRLGGRLHNSLLDPDSKHPLILPRTSSLTTLVIRDAHTSTLHGGTQVTLAMLRRSYWILGGRVPIRSYILRCVKCARQRAATAQQLMGQLPQYRTIPSRPFSNSGVDYAGPITLKTWKGRGAKTYKGYIVFFVCFATSALHLELMTDYTADGFIAAFKRFTGRRGICTTLRSDCGTNLVGADAELRKLFDALSKEFGRLADLLANDGTEWKFNPPSAPHFGGKWEAGVKSVKFHLKRTIGDATLTYEEYSTLLVQIEAVLNSRPLCPLSDDPADVDALTPGHFLTGAAINLIPEPALITVKQSRLSRWQLLRQLLESFWQRWSLEYLQRLQDISKWHSRSDNIKVGALVLITDERYPPSKWPLARVIDVKPGHDGLVRVVTVKTQ